MIHMPYEMCWYELLKVALWSPTLCAICLISCCSFSTLIVIIDAVSNQYILRTNNNLEGCRHNHDSLTRCVNTIRKLWELPGALFEDQSLTETAVRHRATGQNLGSCENKYVRLLRSRSTVTVSSILRRTTQHHRAHYCMA